MNTTNVFRWTNAQGSSVTYDVSDLLPMTSTLKNQAERKMSKNQTGIAPANDTESSRPVLTTSDLNPTTVAELLVKVDEHQFVAPILDTSPMKNIVDSYWGAYQKLFAFIFVFHVVIMSLYSYFSVQQLARCVDFALSTNITVQTTDAYNRTWNSELALAVCLIWPILLIISDIMKVVRSLIGCGRVGVRQSCQGTVSQGEHLFGYIIVQLCGFFYSITTIIWYSMNRYCHVSQDYVLAVSLIFGWVYSFSFTRGFRQVHHFSTILQHIIFRDMMRFVLIYLFILLAFSLSYGALTQAVPSMKVSGVESMFLVFNWMVGMADFEPDSDGIDQVDKSESFMKIIYSVYIILSTIVLLNLLIAMMSDSYSGVRQMSEVMWKVGSLRLPLELEQNMGRSYYRPPQLWFEPDTNRWYIKIHEAEIIERLSDKDLVIQDLTLRIEKLSEEGKLREARIISLLQSHTGLQQPDGQKDDDSNQVTKL